MVHPLYYRAKQWVGRSVYVHHINGTVCHGTLVSAHPHGIYVVQHPAGTLLTAAESTAVQFDHGVCLDRGLTPELVYAPLAYFGFGALTGLTLGAVAGRMWW